MPLGINRTGNFVNGVAVNEPKIFGNNIQNADFGTLIGIQITNRNIIESNQYNQVPGVIITASGDYFLTYKKGVNNSQSILVISRRSNDGGISWTDEVVIGNTSVPDPTVISCPISKDILLSYGKINSSSIKGVAYSRSKDSGITWGDFVWPDNPITDTTFWPSTSISTNDNTIYLVGYGPAAPVTGESGNTPNLWLSTDDGYTWVKRTSLRVTGQPDTNESALIQTGPTNMLVVSRAVTNNTYKWTSDDMGYTWNLAQDITSQVGVLHAPQLLQLNRNVILLFGRNALVKELLVYASYDNGVTFTDRTVLDTYTGIQIDGGYCCPILNKDGNVFVVYYADTGGLRQAKIKSLILHWNKKE